MIGLAQSVALALGGVGFSSPLFALRGRIVLGLGSPGCAHSGVEAASSGLAVVEAVSGARADETPTSVAVGGVEDGCL